jgi:hypothetical protein
MASNLENGDEANWNDDEAWIVSERCSARLVAEQVALSTPESVCEGFSGDLLVAQGRSVEPAKFRSSANVLILLHVFLI